MQTEQTVYSQDRPQTIDIHHLSCETTAHAVATQAWLGDHPEDC